MRPAAIAAISNATQSMPFGSWTSDPIAVTEPGFAQGGLIACHQPAISRQLKSHHRPEALSHSRYAIESGLLATLARKSPGSVFAVSGAIMSVWSLRCAIMITTSVRRVSPCIDVAQARILMSARSCAVPVI